MKKAEQAIVNEKALSLYNKAIDDYLRYNYEVKRLRTCQAEVIITENYYLLRSYNTIVAVIDRDFGYQADVLRNVYGYTATSAQHIAKFFNDFGVGGKYGKNRTYTFR